MCEIIFSHKEQSYTGLIDASQQKSPWCIRITHTPDDSFPVLAEKHKKQKDICLTFTAFLCSDYTLI